MREVQAEHVDAGDEQGLQGICRRTGRTDGRDDFGVPHAVCQGDYVIPDGSTSALVMRKASASASASFSWSSV